MGRLTAIRTVKKSRAHISTCTGKVSVTRWAISAPSDRYPNAADLFSTLRSILPALQYYGTVRDAEGAIFMSVAEIEKLLHDYRTWLRDKTTLREVNGEWIE